MKRLLLLSIALLITFCLFLATQGETAQTETLVLSESNTISLNTPISGESASKIQAKLMNVSLSRSRYQPIYLVLNSPGGDIEAGERIIETAKGLPQYVHTVSLFSASMSFIVSQYLNNRYVTQFSTLMGHRAKAGGMGGEIPGNLLSRTMALLALITQLELGVAERAHINLAGYRSLTADEMWLEGQQAVDLQFADKVVNVRCDSSLNGAGSAQEVDMLFFKAKLTFHKCPLITDPISVEVEQPTSGTAEQIHDSREAFYELIYDRPNFVKNYIETNKQVMR